MILATAYFLPGVQANGVSSAVENAWGIPPLYTGIAIAAVLGIIVIGGVKRIANFATLVVPFMAVIYIVIALVILFANYEQIPEVFGLIFSSAFNLNAGFSGMLGVAIMWGVRRGIYSNEAGQGTGPRHAAAAGVSHPAKQCSVQSCAVYVDTLVVCSASAFSIISTGMYRVVEGESEDGAIVFEGPALPSDIAVGPGFVQEGMDAQFPGFGPSFVALAILFFAFTTILAYYYMAEVNLAYFNRWIKNAQERRGIIWGLRVLVLISVIVGSSSAAGPAWALGDIGVGATAWLNTIAILLIQKPAMKPLKDYYAHKTAGKDPQVDPEALGMKNATFWEKRKLERPELYGNPPAPQAPEASEAASVGD